MFPTSFPNFDSPYNRVCSCELSGKRHAKYFRVLPVSLIGSLQDLMDFRHKCYLVFLHIHESCFNSQRCVATSGGSANTFTSPFSTARLTLCTFPQYTTISIETRPIRRANSIPKMLKIRKKLMCEWCVVQKRRFSLSLPHVGDRMLIRKVHSGDFLSSEALKILINGENVIYRQIYIHI